MPSKKQSPAFMSGAGSDLNQDVFDAIIAESRVQAEKAPEKSSAWRGVSDSALALGQGVVGGVKMLSDIAGPDNAVSETLGKANEGMQGLYSPERTAEMRKRQALIQAADDSGSTVQQITSRLGGIAEAPLDTTLQAAGSMAPNIAAAIATGGVSAGPSVLATAARFGVPAALGVGMGVGSVKGQNYEAVLQKAKQAGMSDADAQALAVKASEYSAENAPQQALGGALGVLDSMTGAERFMAGMARKGIKADTAHGFIRRGVTGGLEEAGPEGLQGSQGQYAQNEALNNAGFKVDPWTGVVGQGVNDAVVGSMVGAPAGAMNGNRKVPQQAQAVMPEPVPEVGPLSKAANVGIAATGPVPVEPAPVALAPEQEQALLALANARDLELTNKANGTKDEKTTAPDGTPVTVPGQPKQFLTPAEKEEQAFLAQNGGDVQALARAYPGALAAPPVEELPLAPPIEPVESVAPEAPAVAGDAQPQTFDTPAAMEQYRAETQAAQQEEADRLAYEQYQVGLDKSIEPPPVDDLFPRPSTSQVEELPPSPTSPSEPVAEPAPQATEAAPASDVLPSDIRHPTTGKPFTTKPGAMKAQKLAGDGHGVVKVAGGFVVRAKDTNGSSVQAPGLDQPAATGSSNQPGGSGVTPVVEPANGRTGELQDTAGPDTSSGQIAPVSPASAGTDAVAASGNSSTTSAQEAKPEFVKAKLIGGNTHHFKQSDIDSDKALIPAYTAEGVKKPGIRVHRENIDPTGEKQAALNTEDASNPLFDVITKRDGTAFADEPSANRALKAQSRGDTHEVVKASEVSNGASGFVLRRKQATGEAAMSKVTEQAPKKELTSTPVINLQTADAPEAAISPAKKPTKADQAATDNEKARADYFTPGNIVKSYGGHDEVLSYTPGKNGSGWSVKVHEVRKVGDQWVRQGKPQDARTHYTQPEASELAKGPIDRLGHQSASEVSYSEPRADGKPFPNSVDRGTKPEIVVDKAEMSPYRKPDGSVGYEAVPIIDEGKTPDYLLRQFATKERPLDGVGISVGTFVTMERAVEFAKKYMTPREWEMPFQFNRVLDINPTDWNRMVAAMSTQKQPSAPVDAAQAATESVAETGDFGPILTQFYHDAQGAIKALTELQNGEAVAALHHPEVGDIDLVWGKAGTKESNGLGLSKLVKWHPEVLDDLQGVISSLKVVEKTENRIQLESETHKAAVRLEWDGKAKHWLLTAFEKRNVGSGTRTDTTANGVEGDTARLKSDVTSVPPAAPEVKAQQFTPADVEAAQKQAIGMLQAAIDKMKADAAQRFAVRFLPTMGVKVPIGKARINAAMADPKINLMAAADALGVKFAKSINDALQAKFEGRIADVVEPQKAEKPTEIAKEGNSTPAPAANTENAGEELKANRRGKRTTGLQWAEIADKDAALRVAETVKAKVYPKPDYQAIADAAPHTLVAYIVKLAYDAIAPKPNIHTAPTDAQLKDYIEGVNAYMGGVLAWAGDAAKTKQWLMRQGTRAGAYLGASSGTPTALTDLSAGVEKTLLETVYPDGWRNHESQVRLIGANKVLGALQPGLDDASKGMKEIDKGWPSKQEAWQKQGYRIIKGDDLKPSYFENDTKGNERVTAYVQMRLGGRNVYVSQKSFDGITSSTDPKVQAWVTEQMAKYQGKFLVLDKRNNVVEFAETEDAAKDKAREATKRESGPDRIDEKGISVEAAKRTGVARRMPGEDISADKLKETYGFRGVNFGNWMLGDSNAKERQLHLNHAYDAFADLAEVLEIPPKAISMNGVLGFAVGAQGSGGRAAAHFVPGVNEINLTREAGAGALAHEWGHALDHYFAKLAGLDRETEAFLTEHTHRTARPTFDARGLKVGTQAAFGEDLRPEILARFKEIVEAMEKRPMTAEEVAAQNASYLATTKSRMDSWVKSVRKDLEDIRPKVMTDPANAETLAAFDKLAEKIKALDVGDGKIAASSATYISPVVDELRSLYKKAAGRQYPIDKIKGLQSAIESVKYAIKTKDDIHEPQKTSTKYAVEARKLDKDEARNPAYWRTKLEMFARAFDAYVSDKLAAKAANNTYLHGLNKDERTVPVGDERTVINAQFDALVQAIETKETDGGNVAMFKSSRSGTSSPMKLSLDAVKKSVESALKRVPNAPRIEVHTSPSAAGITPPDGVIPKGVTLDDGSIVIFSDAAESVLDVFQTVFHELFHRGSKVRFTNNADYIKTMLGIAASDSLVQSAASQWKTTSDGRAKLADFRAKGEMTGNRLANYEALAVEEALAGMGEKFSDKPVARNMLLRRIANFLSKVAQSWGMDSLAKWLKDESLSVTEAFILETINMSGGAANRFSTALLFKSASLSEAVQATQEALKNATVTDLMKQFGNRLSDFRGLGLQTLGRRQLVDIYAKDLPALVPYSDMVAQMEADKNESGAEADALATDWGKLKDARELAALMHDATLAQIDPDKAFVEGDDENFYEALKDGFDKLTDDAKATYRKARDMYSGHNEKVRTAIRERIERSELSPAKRKALLEKMDGEFFKKVKGVYFPLARFGQYVTIVKDSVGNVVSANRSETMNEAEATRKVLQKAFPASGGYKVGKVLKDREFNAARDGVGRGFMEDLFETLEKTGAGDELIDSISQLYLAALPDLSWAKHGIHRKGTPGFSQDARRAFAKNMFHGARYLAKLRYADQLQGMLTGMQEHIESKAEDKSYDTPKAIDVLDEMVKRHASLMNPATNPLSTALTSLGFVFHLGLSPASALVNLSQTALVALPIMGAKWGFTKSSAALLVASKQAAGNKNDISSALSADERAAYDEAVRRGVIDVTMAHDLAGIAQGEDSKTSNAMKPVMKYASFLFHHAEKFNRQVTFVAAYRLAREAGSKPDAAFDDAVKATYDGHFDYGAANRPRLMQGNTAKVVLLFKQYAQNMIYTMTRNAQQAIKAETPEGRAQARKVLAGLLVSHSMAAGVFGLPLVGMLLAAASAIGSDDDEPWDAKVALQNMLADSLGPKAAEVFAHGLSRLTPWDISGRVGLDRLLLPDVREGLDGTMAAQAWAAGALGPVAGIGINMVNGLNEMGKGEYQRGLESMMPSVLRGPLKAWRYGTQGNIDKTGVAINDEVGLAGVAGQALGFSPSETRLAQEGKSAIYSADRAIQARRTNLVRQFALASMASDSEGVMDSRKDIVRFNQKNPNARITQQHLVASVKARTRRINQAKQGVYLPSKRQDAMQAGRFALAE